MQHTTAVALWSIIRKGISEKMLSLATRLFSSEKQSSVPSLTVGNNNKGNIYVFNGPVNFNPPVPPPPTEPSRLQIESNRSSSANSDSVPSLSRLRPIEDGDGIPHGGLLESSTVGIELATILNRTVSGDLEESIRQLQEIR